MYASWLCREYKLCLRVTLLLLDCHIFYELRRRDDALCRKSNQFRRASIFPCSRKRRQRATRLMKIISTEWHWRQLKGRPVDLGAAALLFFCKAVAFVVKWICLCFIFTLYQHALILMNYNQLNKKHFSAMRLRGVFSCTGRNTK